MYFDQAAFGRRLKKIRETMGISQEKMAEKLNISKVHYGNMERGKACCSRDLLVEIGKMKLTEITPRVLEQYYQDLLGEAAAPKVTDRKHKRNDRKITQYTIKRINTVLKSCFHQAMKWELMEKNPAALASTPKAVSKKRKIWDAKTLIHALEVCDDPQLRLAINLAFSCTLRIGEMLALTWDCIDMSEESRDRGRASIYINKELQRVNKEALSFMDQKDALYIDVEILPFIASDIQTMSTGCGFDSVQLYDFMKEAFAKEKDTGVFSTTELADLVMCGLNGDQEGQKKICKAAMRSAAKKLPKKK